jgi:hypothetical protein
MIAAVPIAGRAEEPSAATLRKDSRAGGIVRILVFGSEAIEKRVCLGM